MAGTNAENYRRWRQRHPGAAAARQKAWRDRNGLCNLIAVVQVQERERVRSWAAARGLGMSEAVRRVVFAAVDTAPPGG